MILKLLLIIGVIGVVYFMFFKKKNVSKRSQDTSQQNQDANELVKCEGCGVYLDINDALLSNAKYYCSKECEHKKG